MLWFSGYPKLFLKLWFWVNNVFLRYFCFNFRLFYSLIDSYGGTKLEGSYSLKLFEMFLILWKGLDDKLVSSILDEGNLIGVVLNNGPDLCLFIYFLNLTSFYWSFYIKSYHVKDFFSNKLLLLSLTKLYNFYLRSYSSVSCSIILPEWVSSIYILSYELNPVDYY